jgi:hypothetical protein
MDLNSLPIDIFALSIISLDGLLKTLKEAPYLKVIMIKFSR